MRQETYGATQMRGQPEHVVYVSVGGPARQVLACPPADTFCPAQVCCTAMLSAASHKVSSRHQRFGENKMGKMALAALGMTLVACLVYSAATEVWPQP
jgi:hypothetical protein